MAGAHLDSVAAGPGINDNGTGSAALLEIAEQMAKVKPRTRCASHGGALRSSACVGSTAYVDGLSEAEKDHIALYLNFDMVGSPNYVFMVYDGDDSSFGRAGAVPEGSTAIEDLFESFYTTAG